MTDVGRASLGRHWDERLEEPWAGVFNTPRAPPPTAVAVLGVGAGTVAGSSWAWEPLVRPVGQGRAVRSREREWPAQGSGGKPRGTFFLGPWA